MKILVQSRRNRMAALKLMRRLLTKQGFVPDAAITGKLVSNKAALGDLGMKSKHVSGGRSNNRAEKPYLPPGTGRDVEATKLLWRDIRSEAQGAALRRAPVLVDEQKAPVHLLQA